MINNLHSTSNNIIVQTCTDNTYSCEGAFMDDQFGFILANVKRPQATEDGYVQNVSDSEMDFLQTVLDQEPYFPRIPTPMEKRVFKQPLHCKKCGKPIKKTCYSCMAQSRQKSKTKNVNLCNLICKKNVKPKLVKLGFRDTVTSLRKKMVSILNRQRLEGKNVSIYWKVGTKISEDVNWVASQVVQGELATAHWRILGGMRANRVHNDLIVVNAKDRNYSQTFAKSTKKQDRARIQQYLSGVQQNVNMSDPMMSVPNGQGGFYLATQPLYEGDQSWKRNLIGTLFEDQMEYARWTMYQNQRPITCLNPFLSQNQVPLPINNTMNLMTNWARHIFYIWLPPPTDYCPRYNYACKIVDNAVVYAFPYLGTYQKIVVPTTLTATGQTRLIFNQYEFLNDAVLYTPVLIEVKIPKKNSVYIPQWLAKEATVFFSGKKLTNYTVNTFSDRVMNKLRDTALGAFGTLDEDQLAASIFHVARIKNVALAEMIGLNYDVLNQQNENTRALINIPKNTNLWNILKVLLQWVVPGPVMEILSDWIDTLKWTGLGAFQWIKDIFSSGLSALLLLGLDFVPVPMYLFKKLPMLTSVVIEELIKTVPFCGILVASVETTVDLVENNWDPIKTAFRYAFHALIDILPFPIKVLTLPFRIVGHYLWNCWVMDYGRSPIEMPKKRRPPPDIDPDPSHFEITNNIFEIIDHHEGYERFNESAIQPTPEKLKPKQDWINACNLDVTATPSYIYTVASPKIGNVAGAKTMNNWVNAYIKRNAQPRPIIKLSTSTRRAYNVQFEHIASLMPTTYVSTKEWIYMPTHGSKTKMYAEAYEKYQEDLTINFECTLNLKLDEILFKRVLRTICAFDNSYVVNVAPTIMGMSRSMKQLFNGEVNISMNPKYELFALYCSGVTSHDIAMVIHRFLNDGDKERFLLLSLGDDTALINKKGVLVCDFSRYDSTQHNFQLKFLRRLLAKQGFEVVAEYLERAFKAPVQAFNYKTKEKYQLSTVGLKTGCPETSVSNTLLTIISYATALNEFFTDRHELGDYVKFGNYIETYLSTKCGFLPKMNVQYLDTGFEFLKTIFIQDDNVISAMPLLSAMAKIGKTLKNPREIVIDGWHKHKSQVAVETLYMQLRSKGNLDTIPGWELLYRSVGKMAGLHVVPELNHGVEITNKSRVSPEAFERAYYTRYNLHMHEVVKFFSAFARVPKDQYPFNYASNVLTLAVNVDYDTGIS